MAQIGNHGRQRQNALDGGIRSGSGRVLGGEGGCGEGGAKRQSGASDSSNICLQHPAFGLAPRGANETHRRSNAPQSRSLRPMTATALTRAVAREAVSSRPVHRAAFSGPLERVFRRARQRRAPIGQGREQATHWLPGTARGIAETSGCKRKTPRIERARAPPCAWQLSGAPRGWGPGGPAGWRQPGRPFWLPSWSRASVRTSPRRNRSHHGLLRAAQVRGGCLVTHAAPFLPYRGASSAWSPFFL